MLARIERMGIDVQVFQFNSGKMKEMIVSTAFFKAVRDSILLI
jgi:hypothetical protein